MSIIKFTVHIINLESYIKDTNEAQVENIISRISFTTDKKRLQEYLKTEYPSLIEETHKIYSKYEI